jgi:hypothetical protein
LNSKQESNALLTVLNDVTEKLYSGLQHPVFTDSLENQVVPQTPTGWKISDKQVEKKWKIAVMVLYEMPSGIFLCLLKKATENFSEGSRSPNKRVPVTNDGCWNEK